MNKGADGVWSLNLYLPRGAYEYKYIVDSTWVQDTNNMYARPDPYGGMNSVAVVGYVPVGPKQNGNQVTFLFFDPEAKGVYIAGTFSNWKPVKMYAKGDGTWGIILTLPGGRYEYKFIVDGEWMLDPDNFTSVKSEVGSWDSVVEVK